MAPQQQKTAGGSSPVRSVGDDRQARVGQESLPPSLVDDSCHTRASEYAGLTCDGGSTGAGGGRAGGGGGEGVDPPLLLLLPEEEAACCGGGGGEGEAEEGSGGVLPLDPPPMRPSGSTETGGGREGASTDRQTHTGRQAPPPSHQ